MFGKSSFNSISVCFIKIFLLNQFWKFNLCIYKHSKILLIGIPTTFQLDKELYNTNSSFKMCHYDYIEFVIIIWYSHKNSNYYIKSFNSMRKHVKNVIRSC